MILCQQCGPDKIWIQWAVTHMTYQCQWCGHYFDNYELERHDWRAALAEKRGEKNVVDLKNFYYSDSVDDFGTGCRVKTI